MKFVIVVLLEVASRDARSISFQEGGLSSPFLVPPKGSFSIERFYQPIRRPLLHQNYPFGRRFDGLLISTSAFFGSRDLSPFTDTDSREVIGSGSIIACAESQLTKSPATSETLFASTHQCRVCTSDFSLTTCKSDQIISSHELSPSANAWQILVPVDAVQAAQWRF